MKRLFGDDWIDQTKAINRNRTLINGVIKKREEQNRLFTNSQLYNNKIFPDLKNSFQPVAQSAIIKPIAKTATSKLLEDVFTSSYHTKDMLKSSYSIKEYMKQPMYVPKLSSVFPFQIKKTFSDMPSLRPTIPRFEFKTVNTLKETLLNVPNLNLQNPVLEQLKNINFDHFSEKLNESQREFNKSLEKYDDLHWAVDEELWAALRSGECSDDTIAEYVEENIDDYLNFFSEEEYYNPYSLIIEQAINSFKQEQYASATFNLFAVIDGNITKAFKEYNIPVEQRRNKKREPKTFEKLKHYNKVKTNQDRIAFSYIFYTRMFNVYSIFFQPSQHRKPGVLNRNLIVHGSYKYDEITKEDVLKLVQLVKATSVLENITFEKEKAIS